MPRLYWSRPFKVPEKNINKNYFVSIEICLCLIIYYVPQTRFVNAFASASSLKRINLETKKPDAIINVY